jgi:hypothetical protein
MNCLFNQETKLALRLRLAVKQKNLCTSAYSCRFGKLLEMSGDLREQQRCRMATGEYWAEAMNVREQRIGSVAA